MPTQKYVISDPPHISSPISEYEIDIPYMDSEGESGSIRLASGQSFEFGHERSGRSRPPQDASTDNSADIVHLGDISTGGCSDGFRRGSEKNSGNFSSEVGDEDLADSASSAPENVAENQ